MKRILVTALLTVTTVMLPAAWAEDVQGKMKSVDQTARTVTLEDGIQLTLPDMVRINPDNVAPGATVKASYRIQDGKKMVTAIEVRRAK
jgi:hypothetical protein